MGVQRYLYLFFMQIDFLKKIWGFRFAIISTLRIIKTVKQVNPSGFHIFAHFQRIESHFDEKIIYPVASLHVFSTCASTGV